jgi:hypothetical protein
MKHLHGFQVSFVELYKQAAMITALIIPTQEPLKYKSVLMLWCNCKLPQAKQVGLASELEV